MQLPHRLAIAIVIAAGLVGCGWQLRGGGESALAERRLIVDSQAGEGALVQLTRQSLRRVGAEVAKAGEDAPVLDIIGAHTTRRTIETDEDGRANAWELEYKLRFALNPAAGADEPDASGQPLLRRRAVTASDTYQASPLDTLAEQAQRDRIRDELRDETVRLMLSRVASALGGS